MARKYRINIEGEERVVDVVEQGGRDYLITLDGKTYQTHIEDARGQGSDAASPAVTILRKPASPARASESKLPLPKPPAVDAHGGIQICSPLTGTVTSVKVATGAKVERGQILCLLEAMKMEIEILASHDSLVTMVAVKPSETVQQGDLLFVLNENGTGDLHNPAK